MHRLNEVGCQPFSTTVAYRRRTVLTYYILWLSSTPSAKCAVIIHDATVVLGARIVFLDRRGSCRPAYFARWSSLRSPLSLHHADTLHQERLIPVGHRRDTLLLKESDALEQRVLNHGRQTIEPMQPCVELLLRLIVEIGCAIDFNREKAGDTVLRPSQALGN